MKWYDVEVSSGLKVRSCRVLWSRAAVLNTSLMRQEFTSPNLLKRLPAAPRFFHLSSQQGGRGTFRGRSASDNIRLSKKCNMMLDGQGDVEAEKRLKSYSSSSYEMQGQLIHLDIHHVHYSVIVL